MRLYSYAVNTVLVRDTLKLVKDTGWPQSDTGNSGRAVDPFDRLPFKMITPMRAVKNVAGVLEVAPCR